MPSRIENVFDSVPSEWRVTVPSVRMPSTSIANSRMRFQAAGETPDREDRGPESNRRCVGRFDFKWVKQTGVYP